MRELADSTRTAADAAAAVGCEVGQIVKSLVFRRGEEIVMCLCAGDRQVDTKALGLERADAETVREATGFAIGGAPARPRPQPPDARRLVAAPLRNRLVRRWHPERRVRGVDGPVAGRRRGLTLSLSCDREDWRVDAFGS